MTQRLIKNRKIIYKVFKMNFAVFLLYIILVIAMVLAPVIQIRLLQEIIDKLGRIIEVRTSSKLIRNGLVLIITEGAVLLLINVMDNISEFINGIVSQRVKFNLQGVIVDKVKT